MNMNFNEGIEKPLEKYGRDITKAALDGKIDPVIGRDEEIIFHKKQKAITTVRSWWLFKLFHTLFHFFDSI